MPAEANLATSPAPWVILFVEDDPLVRWATEAMFVELGHAVTSAATGQEALRSLATERFDVLFTDLGLPDIAGSDLARQATARAGDLRVIIATGYQDSDLAGEPAEGWFHLAKPYHSADLQRALSAILS